MPRRMDLLKKAFKRELAPPSKQVSNNRSEVCCQLLNEFLGLACHQERLRGPCARYREERVH